MGGIIRLPMMDNDKLDKQHTYLLRLFEAHEGKADISRDEVFNVIRALLLYGMEHFRYEEVIMRAYDYPKYWDHKAEHDRFYNLCKHMIIDSKNVEVGSLLGVLKGWLVDHICTVDAEYARWRSNDII